jgi:Anti-sigma-K factor rskA, C-terminal
MATDDELSELLATALDDGPDTPPPDRIAALRARAEAARAERAAPPAPITAASTDQRRGISPWLAAAAAVVALALGFGVATFLERRGDEVAGSVEYAGPMTGPDGAPRDARLEVVATGIGRVVELDTDVLPNLPKGEYYQVWFVGPGDTPATPNRISAGTFHPDPDGRSDVRFAAAVNPELYPIVEITAEPRDGNPAPTGPTVLRAELATS